MSCLHKDLSLLVQGINIVARRCVCSGTVYKSGEIFIVCICYWASHSGIAGANLLLESWLTIEKRLREVIVFLCAQMYFIVIHITFRSSLLNESFISRPEMFQTKFREFDGVWNLLIYHVYVRQVVLKTWQISVWVSCKVYWCGPNSISLQFCFLWILEKYSGNEWMHLARDRDQWLAVVNTVMNLPFPEKTGKFLASWLITGFYNPYS
jgi:hypothetical protein